MEKPEIKFGPAGLGPVKDAIKNLETYNKLGLKACEIAFTYGVYIKKEEDAIAIGNRAKELGIKLTMHGQYWINLNSSDPEKIKKSKERILDCCRIGTLLGAEAVIFHPGFFGKIKETKVSLINHPFKNGVKPDYKEEAYQNIKNAILEIMEISKEKGYTRKLAPETMGKVNVFGSAEEIRRLVKETGCSFCIDFAHILARDKDYRFREIKELFKELENWHVHFSGIVYGEKGEKHHIITPKEEFRKLLDNLPSDKRITIINESPSPVEDSVMGLKIYQE